MHITQKIKERERQIFFFSLAKILVEIMVVAGFVIIIYLLIKNFAGW
jgi:hypothetical protein